jgi:hypothetical protein
MRRTVGRLLTATILVWALVGCQDGAGQGAVDVETQNDVYSPEQDLGQPEADGSSVEPDLIPDPPGSDVSEVPEVPEVPEEFETESNMSSEKDKMQQYFEAVEYEVEGGIEGYALPLVADQIVNFDTVVNVLGLHDATEQLLEDGFVVVPYGKEEDMVEVYRMLMESPVPAFVTTDTWLHLYHVQFDETLKTLEETLFYFAILDITDRMLEEAKVLYGDSEGMLKEAARRNVAFLSIARQLLVIEDDAESKPEQPVPDYVAGLVEKELEYIDAHKGFEDSPLFHYKEDYSQYVPRGHYTRSELLKSYFRTMMWYGRMTMLLKGAVPACPLDSCPALILPEEADIQTLQGLIMTLDMSTLDVAEGRIDKVWEKVYLVTSFFVGTADDLSFYEYLDSIVAVLGEGAAVAQLTQPGALFDIRLELAKKKSPQIYGGTGGQVIVVEAGQPLTPEMLEPLLEKTKGFRFMGQRFIPDSFIMGRLVAPGSGNLGDGCDAEAFTAVQTPAGLVRGFPRGLDIMASLGSSRAPQWLSDLGDDCYTNYGEVFDEMKLFLDEQDEAQWHGNLYWGWLHALRALLSAPPEGTQTFMLTDAYADRSMNAALASWAELRHDTILYAKQSYTPDINTSEQGPPAPPPGYVEPNAEFLARLLELNEMTIAGLADMEVLPPDVEYRLEALSELLARMLYISVTELEGLPLPAEDIALIASLADSLDAVVAGVEDAGVKTTMVADVHTDQNSKKVLEEGVGYVQLLVAAYRLPDGTISLGAGPTLSYYEFKHPMDDRLTDEAWREILEDGETPDAPEWTLDYTHQ